ncbi:hypothetical protein [Dokdonella koreensis]|uniref:NHL repeat containing protein n=1 Tax=Dokdonella koreensis DS-123 TaxID=1300342 RepID=A0A160DU47_9GAMM|nr:hypothetical protein [Dokdonella koreensis]ANB17955.1 Hypothetical protein I596_1933 [Dokdonella koreensis DS-123]
MKIRPLLLCCLVVALCAPAAMAQVALPAKPANQKQKELDPATLTEAQIKQVQLPAVLGQLASIYQEKEDMRRLTWTLERLGQLRPSSGEVKLALAAAYANLDDKSRAYDVLLKMQQQGFGYNLADDPRFKKVSDTQVWTYAVENLRANLKPFGEGKVAFDLPKGDYLFESIGWDPKRKQFLVGSVREGKVYLVDKAGKLTDFIAPNAQNGLWGVHALAVDAERDALYVASTASIYYKGFSAETNGQAGLFKFKLSTGAFVEKYLLPDAGAPHTLSSVVVSRKGQVFATDGVKNLLYRLEGKNVKPLMNNPRLTSLRGVAVSDDGKLLYFADFTHGIAGLDLTTGKGFDLHYNAAALVLSGIEGLYWYDNTLIAVEPGMSPKRVLRMHLTPDGRALTKVMPLDAAKPEFGFPTVGTVADGGFYFIADSRRAHYDSYGVAKDDGALAPVRIYRSDARFAWDQKGIDVAVGKEIPPGGNALDGDDLRFTPARPFSDKPQEQTELEKALDKKGGG